MKMSATVKQILSALVSVLFLLVGLTACADNTREIALLKAKTCDSILRTFPTISGLDDVPPARTAAAALIKEGQYETLRPSIDVLMYELDESGFSDYEVIDDLNVNLYSLQNSLDALQTATNDGEWEDALSEASGSILALVRGCSE